MRIGTAARLWDRLEPDDAQYGRFRDVLERQGKVVGGMELCYVPFSMEEGLRGSLAEPPATLLVLPDGLGEGRGGASAHLRGFAQPDFGRGVASLPPCVA